MRIFRICIVGPLVYKVLLWWWEPLNIRQEKDAGARSQALDLPVTDQVLWASHWITRSSVASCGRSIGKQNTGMERNKVLMTVTKEGALWEKTPIWDSKTMPGWNQQLEIQTSDDLEGGNRHTLLELHFRSNVGRCSDGPCDTKFWLHWGQASVEVKKGLVFVNT